MATDAKQPIPYSRAGFAAAVEAHPDLHPAQAIMRGLAGPKKPVLSVAQLEARRASEVAFWSGAEHLPYVQQAIHAIEQRYAWRIAQAKRRESPSHAAVAS